MNPAEECIALATDEGYVAQACVVIVSYALSNPLNRRDIFVFVDNVSEEGIRMLSTTGAAFGLSVTCIKLDNAMLRDLGRHSISGLPHVSVATYGKLLIPRSLPERYLRCLILDCDVLVRGNLDPLFATDLQGRCLGAAKDAVDALKSVARLGLSADSVYFNSGVMLIDLNLWKSEKPMLRIPDVTAEKHNRMIFMEQDILNLLFNGQFKQLDPKWNAIMVIIPAGYVRNWTGIPEEQLILHFAGELKPWHEFYHPVMRNLYLGYAKVCSWIKIPSLGPSGAVQKKAALILAKEFGLKDLTRQYSA